MAPPPRGRFYVEKFLGLKHHVGVACIGCVYLSKVSAARRVYVFTTALAVLCVFGLFDETGFVALILTSYAAVVARSHWIQLVEAATPALGYVVGEDSPAKPAADKV